MQDEYEETQFQRAKLGEKTAFDRLQKILEIPVQRFLRRLIGNHPEEEDIMRDAFLALYLNLDRIPNVDMLRPFLFRVLRNLSYSELRRQGRFKTISLNSGKTSENEELFDLPEKLPSPDEQVQWIMLYGQIQKAIDSLPEVQRETIILYFDEQMTYEQIASALATDMGTVKSRIHYARKNLLRNLPKDTAGALGINKENK